jgi:thymidine phosphorylase
LGLAATVVKTDGRQPVGRGIGPALEARDVLAVLRGEQAAPSDLRERSLTLAGALLELTKISPAGAGVARARALLESGAAWKKFQGICDAQGGMRELPTAGHTRPWVSPRRGRVDAIDNRRFARLAKLTGAPRQPAAGVTLHVSLGSTVSIGEPLCTLHAGSPGELAYALEYAAANSDMIRIDGDES